MAARRSQATLAGPAGIAVVPDGDGTVTLFIADYYNGRVRAVGPDGIIRDVSDDGGEAFGAPTRVAYAPTRRGWLYVTDSSSDQRRRAEHPEDRAEPRAAEPRPPAPALPRKAQRVSSRRRRVPQRRCCPGRCRSCGRTAAAWRCSSCCC